MNRNDLTALYEQQLADLHSFNDRVIATTRAWAGDPTLAPSLSALMEELRLRTHLVKAARAMAEERQPAIAAVA